jgi:hypothetical protein
MMLNIVARELQYFGLERMVDAASGDVSWAATLRLGEQGIYYGAGSSPNAALASVLNKVLVAKGISTLDVEDMTLGLDALADDLLRLVLTRTQANPRSGTLWHLGGHFRQERAFLFFGPTNRPATIEVDGASPDEALHEFVRRAIEG